MTQSESLQLTLTQAIDPLDQPAVLRQVSTSLGVIEIARVDGRVDAETVIMGLPWSEFVARKDAFDRYGIMARAMGGASFTAVNHPGVGRQASRLRREDILQIRAGDLSAVARAQWEAIGDTPSNITLLGNSQGASTVAALAAYAPEGVAVEKLFLWEPITKKQSIFELVGRFGLEATQWRGYLEENPKWMSQPGNGPLIPKEILPHIAAYYSYPVGLSKGKIFRDMQIARERNVITPDTEIVIMSGDKSRVSPSKENDIFAQRLEKELGLKCLRLILLNESHGLIDSSIRVSALLRHFYPAAG